MGLSYLSLLLPIVFAVRKFHDCICGCKFILYSDHIPLQYLLNESKQIPILASSRIQCWAITLAAYNYTIKHKPGTQLSHADALNHLPLLDQPIFVPIPHNVVLVLNHISEVIVSADSIKEWTNKDLNFYRLCNLVLTVGQIPEDPTGLKPYTHCFTELSIADCCLLRGSRVIVPPPGYSLLLSQLHETHPGISRMKSLVCCYFWWPGLDKARVDDISVSSNLG